MDTSATKKRKRTDDGVSRRKKKEAVAEESATATVKSLLRPKTNPPIIATSPGLNIPLGIPFQRRSVPKPRQPEQAKQSLILQSNAHRTLDYTAQEDDKPLGATPALKHYLAAYDPATGRLDVIEAKKMVIRGVVRAKQLARDSTREQERSTMSEQKADLSQAFGTRKAKEALRNNALNALEPAEHLAFTSGTRRDDATQAIMDVIGDKTARMATREELQAVVTETKPVPKANLDAEEIQDAYDPEVIIGADVLHLVPIRDWQESVEEKKTVQVASRFVASRINRVATGPDAIIRLRILRYLLFVILFFLSSRPGKQGTRRIPSRDVLRNMLKPAPDVVLENIRRKFSEGSEMRKFHADLLMTHCCVFAAIVDGFEVDTQHLKDDLRLDQKSMNAYFQEIGAKIKQSTEKRVGETKKTRVTAKLSLPLVFPKQRPQRFKR